MAIKIEMLRCFAAVVESGNLAGAAARLNRSPSAVSMMLKQLEDHLGKPLFETDRKRDLSPLGRFVIEQARIELRQFDRSVQSIEEYARAGIGVVRVAAVPSVAGTVLPTAFETFLERHPNVQVSLRDMNSAGVLEALDQERADIGVATVSDSAWTSGRTHLFDDEFGLICRPDHALAADDEPVRWEELEKENFIGNELCESIRSPVSQALCRQARLVIYNTGSLLAMVKAGLGVTVLPRTVIELHPGETVFRSIDDPSAVRRIDLLYRSGNAASPLADDLVQHVVNATFSVMEQGRIHPERIGRRTRK